ncbi:MAG: PEP/pyruvate-binding domain-containing protein [Candidatus Thermoplasmatota archaeon]|nr:PEP/pyruvate-binding domain-containing protein [Candidatus Thermoplasmatota archaeon]
MKGREDGQYLDLKGNISLHAQCSDNVEQDGNIIFHRITNILLISTAYDLFLLEEEGRLIDHFRESYIQSGSSFIPVIDHACNSKEALGQMDRRTYDLVISFNPPHDMTIEDLARSVKEKDPGTKFGLLACNTPEVQRIYDEQKDGLLDMVLTWSGDGTILETMVKLMEDLSATKNPDPDMNPSEMIIIGKNVGETSRYLETMSPVIREMFDLLLGPYPTRKRRRRLSLHIPRITIARTVEEAYPIIKDPNRRFVGAVANYPDLTMILEGKVADVLKQVPAIIITDEHEIGNIPENRNIICSREENIEMEIKRFTREILLPKDLSQSPGCKLKGPIDDLRSLEKMLRSHDDPEIQNAVNIEELLRWSILLCEPELVSWSRNVMKNDGQFTVQQLLGKIRSVKRSYDRGMIRKYTRDRSPEGTSVMRIGKGPMGGKARGLAFMDMVLSDTVMENQKGPSIKIPNMTIICTDMFQRFISDNGLLSRDLLDLSDERIAERFLSADLPSILTGDLRSIVKTMKEPLSVRSSSLLEDAAFQPFAGVYASLMIPNSDNSIDKRFRDLARAVKYVYASTFFKEARDYIRTTNNRIEEENMGVIIQKVSGKGHGDFYYPMISGVARSYDFWPLPGCNRKDGTVNIALGLGKTIVEGMGAWKFSPSRPDISVFNDVKELLDTTQRKFYAIDLKAKVPGTHPEETSTLITLDLERALEQGTADLLTSTVDIPSGRIYPGPHRDGPKVVDFAPILKERTVPLPEVLKELLLSGEKALGGPVEIEFTVDIDGDEREMTVDLLQIRSMVAGWGSEEIEITPEKGEVLLFRSKKVLGSGVDMSCRDLVYVTDPGIDQSVFLEVAKEVSEMNRKLLELKRPYILVGPGRWGSSDPWLGIPLNWSDISGARTIVETPMSGRIIDPSQGSHFFQNLSSLKRSYFTISPKETELIDREHIDRAGIAERTVHLTHVEFRSPMISRIDGTRGEGTISISDMKKKVRDAK